MLLHWHLQLLNHARRTPSEEARAGVSRARLLAWCGLLEGEGVSTHKSAEPQSIGQSSPNNHPIGDSKSCSFKGKAFRLSRGHVHVCCSA